LDQIAVDELLGYRSEIIIELYTLKGIYSQFPYPKQIIRCCFGNLTGDPAAKYIQTQPVNISPRSDDSFEQVRTWIKECLHKHPHCPGPQNSMIPTRVVQILDGGNVELCLGDHLGSYTTLWGGPQTFATTLETLERNSRGLRLSEVPQTLRDGVHLTRKLWLQYVWIDSLFIIQDSVADKEQEILKMSQYYKENVQSAF
jgi:Heterokaryon incompatibility protein (HET)